MAFTLPKKKKAVKRNQLDLEYQHILNQRPADCRKFTGQFPAISFDQLRSRINAIQKCRPESLDFDKMVRQLGFDIIKKQKSGCNVIVISTKSPKKLDACLIKTPKYTELKLEEIVILLACIDYNHEYTVIIDSCIRFPHFLRALKQSKNELYEYIVFELFNKNKITII